MIKTFKTKQEVLVEPRLMTMAVVYLEVNEVRLSESNYLGITTYYYIDSTGVRVDIEQTTPHFSVAEARQIENTPTNGLFADEHIVDLIVKSTFYQLSAGGYFGLTGTDWEEYVLPDNTTQNETPIA